MPENTDTTEQWTGTPFDDEPDLPWKISRLRQKLYCKAKTEPKFRFWALYDRIYLPAVLLASYERSKRNAGAPGVDGVSFEDIEREDPGAKQFLAQLHEELRTKTYRPQAVLRRFIPKANGKLRPLGIPTIKDRVVQRAALLILEPIFEADFRDSSFGFRPGRGAHDALRALTHELRQGRTEVLDADLASYFDSIPHDKLMLCVELRVADGSVLRLIRAWLETPIEDRDDEGRGKPRRHRPSAGTPQGGVISPLLANVYLHCLDVMFARHDGPGTWAKAKLIRYADDFVIVARHVGKQITEWTQKLLEERMGLKLNVEKTAIRRIQPGKERLHFLGFEMWWKKPHNQRKGRWHYLHLGPSRNAIERIKGAVREQTSRRWNRIPVDAVVAMVNRRLRGWIEYFRLGYPSDATHVLDRFAAYRIYRHLRRRSQRPYCWPRDRTIWQHAHADLGLLVLSEIPAKSMTNQ